MELAACERRKNFSQRAAQGSRTSALTRQPQDDVAVALARAAHGSETIDNRLREVDEGLAAAAVYMQHGAFRQGLSDGDEGGLGDGDADHRPDLGAARRNTIRSPNVAPRREKFRRNLMVRPLAFLAALLAMGVTAHAQDDPGALRGVYGSSGALPSPATNGQRASAAPSLPGVYGPGEIAPGTSAPPSSHAIGSSGTPVPKVSLGGAPSLAGVYAPGQAAPASRTAVVAPNGAIVGTGQSFTMWSAPGVGQGPIPGSRIYPFPGSQGGPLSVGQALPLNIVPAPLADQPNNGMAVVNGHRLILERGTNRIIQDLD
jgi:hypothetical protein